MSKPVAVGPLPAAQRQAVGRVSQRAHMVRLSARGYTAPQIARVFDWGPDVVRQWWHRYRARGAAGRKDLPRSGRPPRDRLAAPIIDAQASQPPACAGAFLAVRFGVRLSADRVRHYLHAPGGRWARPRLAPATPAPARPPKQDPAAPLKLALIARARGSAATVLYLDECALHLLPVVRARWMKGPRLRVPTPGQNAKRAFFGALAARTGALQYRVRPKKLAVHFVEFLDRLAQTYPDGDVVLVLDNVITHAAKVVRRWLAQPAPARFRRLWLPKYSAHEYNPIERVWGLLKDAVAANRLAGSIDALVEAAQRCFATTRFAAPYPTSDTSTLPAVA